MRKYEFSYADVQFEKHIRNCSGDVVQVLAYVKLVFKTKDLSWSYNVRSHKHRLFKAMGHYEMTKELQAKASMQIRNLRRSQ